jgi:hypothetical protein
MGRICSSGRVNQRSGWDKRYSPAGQAPAEEAQRHHLEAELAGGEAASRRKFPRLPAGRLRGCLAGAHGRTGAWWPSAALGPPSSEQPSRALGRHSRGSAWAGCGVSWLSLGAPPRDMRAAETSISLARPKRFEPPDPQIRSLMVVNEATYELLAGCATRRSTMREERTGERSPIPFRRPGQALLVRMQVPASQPGRQTSATFEESLSGNANVSAVAMVAYRNMRLAIGETVSG